MITELETVAAIPPRGFVHDYVAYALLNTTAPLCYHLGTALSILAVTCPLDYGTFYAGKLRANIYTLLVGRSGEDQKSTALALGHDILFEAASPLVGDYPGSAEGLIESLHRQPSQLLTFSEFGKFLSAAQKGYYEPVKALLADLWDCAATQRAKATKQGADKPNVIKVQNPRLSILAACSMPYLEKYSAPEDWTGGFMGRWAVLYGRRERIDPDPVGNRDALPGLAKDLYDRACLSSAGWCARMNGPAKRRWDDWFGDVSTRMLPSNIVGIRSRAPSIARKVALLYGWDFGPARAGEPWEMSLDELEPGIAFAELHLKSLVGLAEHICEHPDARMRRSVIDVILELGGQATLGELLNRLKMRKRPVAEALDALLEEKVLTRGRQGGELLYVLRSAGEAEDPG